MNDLPFDSDPQYEHDLAYADSPCPTPAPSPIQSAKKEQRVLVMEDDPVQLQLLRQQLDSLELRTVSASTIEEASNKLEEHEFQLAILDVHLPDGSGLDLCAKIDDDPRLTGLPVVILSNSTQADIVRRTRASGGCYFLGKPYDPNVLLTVIERALAES